LLRPPDERRRRHRNLLAGDGGVLHGTLETTGRSEPSLASQYRRDSRRWVPSSGRAREDPGGVVAPPHPEGRHGGVAVHSEGYAPNDGAEISTPPSLRRARGVPGMSTALCSAPPSAGSRAGRRSMFRAGSPTAPAPPAGRPR